MEKKKSFFQSLPNIIFSLAALILAIAVFKYVMWPTQRSINDPVSPTGIDTFSSSSVESQARADQQRIQDEPVENDPIEGYWYWRSEGVSYQFTKTGKNKYSVNEYAGSRKTTSGVAYFNGQILSAASNSIYAGQVQMILHYDGKYLQGTMWLSQYPQRAKKAVLLSR